MSQSEVLDALAVVAATAAFCATAWQAAIARDHNRLSVRPTLTWTRDLVQSSGGGVELTFSLVNNGVGPAFIRERFFMVNGHRWTPPENEDAVSALASQVIGATLDHQIATQQMPGIGAPIPAGQSCTIARIIFPGATRTSVEALMRHANVQFLARYECLYDISRWVSSADHLLSSESPTGWKRLLSRG